LYGSTSGFEIGPDWRPATWWRLDGSYAYLHMDLKTRPGSVDVSTAKSARGSSPHHQVVFQSSLDLPGSLEFSQTYRYVSDLPAQAPKITEYQVKAAYLANFGRFVEWSGSAAVAKSESFNICVLGRDPFGADLDAALAGETIGGAHMLAKRISRPQDAVDCRILFIS